MKIMKKARADALLVERGLADSVAKARALIMAGRVASAGRQIEKAGEPLAGDVPLSLKAGRPYVGRGGLKLAEALDAFRVSPSGLVCADIGVSTGGFTDCLLQRGALRVYAVDVSVRQIDERLRRDRRVSLIEKNARLLQPGDFPEPVGLVVMDVSFISILKILPALAAVLRSGRETAGGEEPILLSLIKPQFEADRKSVGRGGVIRNPEIHDRVLRRVAAGARAEGFALSGLLRLNTRGQKGNVEFLGRFGLSAPKVEPLPGRVLEWISAAVKEADPDPGGNEG